MINIANISIGLISYLVGFASGFVICKLLISRGISLQESKVIFMVVTSIWAISMLIDILNPEYETSVVVHGIMGSIVGFFYKSNNTNEK